MLGTTDPALRNDIRYSFVDGGLANMFATLTGGVFLTGFALYLGMNEVMIGILAAMPFLATVFQLPASYVIERKGGRRPIAYGAAAMARTVWIVILVVGLLPIPGKIYFVLALACCSYILASVSYVSWLSWMSDLIPDRMRGRFFGTRNMMCGAAGIAVMFIFGHLLDYLKAQPDHDLSLGFGITFSTAVALGLWGLNYLRKISEPPMARNAPPAPFRMHLALPFTSPDFRRFALFALVWNFSVYFASPFFTLYFLRDLKFSYGFVALMGMTSAFADLLGMQVWGRISDRVKNKAVIQVGSWVAAFLPLAWVTVRPDSVVVPLILHLVGGGFWAGINLCMNNLLLRITPQENRGSFLSAYNVLAGLGAAAGPVLAGLAVRSVEGMVLHVASWQISSLQFVFVASTIMRILSVPLLTYVREPEAATIGQMVRILRSVRGLNTANGFTSLLHPFIETVRNGRRGLGNRK